MTDTPKSCIPFRAGDHVILVTGIGENALRDTCIVARNDDVWCWLYGSMMRFSRDTGRGDCGSYVAIHSASYRGQR